MARSSEPRIVAELGRAETPDETAARKAESSRVYRASQNWRSLVGALVVTIAVVVVIIFAVPRGTPPPAEPIDVAAVAERIGSAEGREAIAPDLSDDWTVNRAAIEGDGVVRAWTIVYVPADENERGFLRIAQGFDADAAWAARVLSGAAPVETLTAGGVQWDRYELDPSRSGNLSVALATSAGDDTVLIYGAATDEKLEQAAAAVSAEVLRVREESE